MFIDTDGDRGEDFLLWVVEVSRDTMCGVIGCRLLTGGVDGFTATSTQT